jgi:hypothetical protein
MSEPTLNDGGATTILGRADATRHAPPPRKGDYAVFAYVDAETVPGHRRGKARKLLDRAAARLSLVMQDNGGTTPTIAKATGPTVGSTE